MKIFQFWKKKQSTNQPEVKNPSSREPFYLIVDNKYYSYGGVYAEGKMKKGDLIVGESVYIYSKDSYLKYENAQVIGINDQNGNRVDRIKAGNGMYAAIRIDRVKNIHDIDYGDIITAAKLDIKPGKKKEKKLPVPKTFNDPDRQKHIDMVTNNLSSMFVSGSINSNKEWVQNLGQDLYDAHGLDAMHQVYVNIKTKHPKIHRQLSEYWNGIGGWLD